MHLVSARDQIVTIPGLEPVRFPAGESIRTEISTKYDRESVAALFAAADLRIEAWPRDPATPFGLVLGARA
jgi:L-histidine N-alpha-methyltransferase